MRSLPIFLLAFLLSACGGNSSYPASDTQNGSTDSSPSTITGNDLAVIQSSNAIVAYITSIGAGAITAYLPTQDRYVGPIRLADGTYQGGAFYFPNTGCSGIPFTPGFAGEVGKTIVFDAINSLYYVVTSLISSNAILTYQSFSTGTSCVNAGGTWPYYEGAGYLALTSRPYNFNSIAPLTVKFP